MLIFRNSGSSVIEIVEKHELGKKQKELEELMKSFGVFS